jgi:hypothetical protein
MKAVRQTLCSAIVVAFVAGCAGPQMRLAQDDRKALADAPQIHLVHQAPMRIFTIEGRAQNAALFFGGIIGVMANVNNSMALQSELKLEDPVLRVKQRMAAALTGELGLRNVRVVEELMASDQVDELRGKLESGLVLDVRTIEWGLHNDRARYAGRARLLRLADSTLLWQANCEHVVDEDKESPTRDALVANEGALLKANLVEAAERCADHLAVSLAGKGG